MKSFSTLKIFRVVFATLLLMEAAYIAPDLTRLFSENGFLNAQLMRALGIKLIPNISFLWKWTAWEFSSIVYSVFAVYCLSILGLIAGVKVRLMTVLAWATQAFFMNSTYLGVYGVDRYFQLVLFLAIFSPWGEKTPDPKKEKFWLGVLQLTIAMTYANAGIAKMFGSDWWSGTAIWRAVHLPEFHRYDLYTLAQWPWVFKLLCWTTVLGEAVFPVALFFKRARWVLVPVAILMHLGISLFLGLHLFAATMIAMDICLFLLPDLEIKKGLSVGFKPRTNPIFSL